MIVDQKIKSVVFLLHTRGQSSLHLGVAIVRRKIIFGLVSSPENRTPAYCMYACVASHALPWDVLVYDTVVKKWVFKLNSAG